jgi:carbon storage regulator
MLALDRKVGESIIIGDNLITITIIDKNRARVRVGIDAPKNISVHRKEVFDKIKGDKENEI